MTTPVLRANILFILSIDGSECSYIKSLAMKRFDLGGKTIENENKGT